MSHLKAQTAQWSQGSAAVVQNLQWFETLLEAVHKKQLNESSAPMSVPARTSYVSSVTWCTPSSTYCSRGFSGMCPRLQVIPTALLSGTQPAGFLQDPHSWDNTHHTTKPLSFQDRHLQRPFEDTTTSPSVGSLEVRRKLLQNWTRFYSVSAQRTGLQWLGRGYPWRLQKPSDLVTCTAHTICTNIQQNC